MPGDRYVLSEAYECLKDARKELVNRIFLTIKAVARSLGIISDCRCGSKAPCYHWHVFGNGMETLLRVEALLDCRLGHHYGELFLLLYHAVDSLI